MAQRVRGIRSWLRRRTAGEYVGAWAQRLGSAPLVDLAGAGGTQADGSRLDQREFKQTIDALERIAIHQARVHEVTGRYDPDALASAGDVVRSDLPPDHGITLLVTARGHTWCAWRRTVTGFVLGRGARGLTLTDCFYEDYEEPTGLPGNSPGWVAGLEHAPNWRRYAA